MTFILILNVGTLYSISYLFIRSSGEQKNDDSQLSSPMMQCRQLFIWIIMLKGLNSKEMDGVVVKMPAVHA